MNIRIGFLIFVVVGIVADLWTKDWAFRVIPDNGFRNIVVVPGWLEITNVRNSGMAWSLFQGLDPRIWIVVRGVLTLGLVWMWNKSAGGGFWINAAFACVVSGAVGNLHDNMFADHGHVRDFISVILGTWRFPVFNIADSLITCGAPILVLGMAGESNATEKEAA